MVIDFGCHFLMIHLRADLISCLLSTDYCIQALLFAQ